MKMHTYLAMAGMAAALSLGTQSALAQADNGGGGRRNFDPAQFAQMRLDRAKENLEITDDTEWKAIQPLVQKVQDAQMAAMADRIGGGMRGMFGGGRRRGGNDNGDQGGGNNGGNGGRRGFGGPAASAEADALQKAVDAKASKAELSAALDRYIASRKAKQAALEQAEDNLRKVLTKRQEALAVLHGLL